MASQLKPELLEILACPLTKAPVVLDGDRLVSTDPKTRLAYRVEDDIPIMLIEEAAELSEDEHRAILEKHQVQPWQPTENEKETS